MLVLRAWKSFSFFDVEIMIHNIFFICFHYLRPNNETEFWLHKVCFPCMYSFPIWSGYKLFRRKFLLNSISLVIFIKIVKFLMAPSTAIEANSFIWVLYNILSKWFEPFIRAHVYFNAFKRGQRWKKWLYIFYAY